MLVKVKFIKDHNGYKAGDEWPMMLSYAEKYKAQGIVQIVGGDIDKWFVKPEVDEQEDEQLQQQNETEDPIEENQNTFFGLLNNKKK